MGNRFITKGIKGHESMQAKVKIYSDGTIEMVSYATPIVRATPVQDRLYTVTPIESGKFWDGEKIYTATTARQVSYFLAEYFEDLSYPEFKKSALRKDISNAAHLRKEVNLDYGF